MSGPFCANCGQEQKEIRRPIVFLLKDAVKSVFELDGRMFQTLYLLFTHPGFLSREYVSGRRVRYTPPLRLFLIITIVFFLLVSAFTSLRSIRESIIAQNNPEAVPERTILIEADTGDNASVERIYAMVDNFSLPFFSDRRNENLRRFMRSQAENNIDEIRKDPAGFLYDSLDYVTVFILLMMPILALIQKLLYFRSKRFYVEHLILTLHNHAFLMLAIFLLNSASVLGALELPGIGVVMQGVQYALNFWIVAYLFLSLRNFFEQSYFVTICKFITMAIIYSIVTVFGLFYFVATLFFLF